MTTDQLIILRTHPARKTDTKAIRRHELDENCLPFIPVPVSELYTRVYGHCLHTVEKVTLLAAWSYHTHNYYMLPFNKREYLQNTEQN